MALLLGALLSLATADGATISWVNSAGGNWGNPTNWDSGTVPGPLDNVLITLSGSYSVVLNTNVTVNNLTVGGANGTQMLNWAASNLVVTTFSIGSNASFTMGAGKVLNMSGTINNQGTINWGTTNALVALGNCTLNNFGVLNLQTNFTTSGFSDIYHQQNGAHLGMLNTSGTVLVPPNVGTITFLPNIMYFTNSGTITVGTNSTLALQAGSQNSVSMTFIDGTLIAGAGLVQNVNCILVATGNITINGTFEMDAGATLGGTHTLTGIGSLNWHGGNFGDGNNIYGNIVLPNETTTFGTNFHVNVLGGANMTAQNVNNQGILLWISGNLNNVEQRPANFTNSGSLILQGSLWLYYIYGISTPAATFNNLGTISVLPGNVLANLKVIAGWTFTNSGTFYAPTNSTFDINSFPTNGMAFVDGTVIGGGGTVTFGYSSSGTSYLTANGTITVNGPPTTFGTFVLYNWAVLRGTQTWTGTGTLALSNPTLDQPGTTTFATNFQVYAGSSTVTIDNHVVCNQGNYYVNAGLIQDLGHPATFNNSGTVTIKQVLFLGGSPGASGYIDVGSSFNNTGTILMTNQTNGRLLSDWHFTNSGTIDAEANSILTINAINLTLNEGTVFAGGGQVELNVRTSSDFVGSLTANGSIKVNNSLALGSEMVLQGTQSWSGTGSLTWSGGSFVQPGITTIESNFLFNLADDPNDSGYSNSNLRSLAQSHVVNNQGILMWNSSHSVQASNHATFLNSGLVVLQTNCTLQPTTADCAFTNQVGGIVRVANGNSAFNCPFVNFGTMDLELGTLTLSNNYMLSASSLNRFAVGGPSTALTVLALNAGGGLGVSLTNGYVVTNGSKFTLINYSSHSGTFASVQAPPPPPALSWKFNYGSTSLTLEAVTKPTQVSAPTVLPNGTFQFTFSGPPANSYLIQASSNLVDWVTLQTNSPFSGQISFTDATATNYVRRYYRGMIGF